MIKEILIQAGYYLISMSIGIFLISLIQRGIFWPLVKARLGFGRYVLVKLRQVHRDYLMTGEIEDGFLVFDKKENQRRIALPDNSFFYKVSGLTFIDVEDESGSLCRPDYTTTSGFDPKKYNNLYIRTLYKPTVMENQDKIIMGGIFLIIVLLAIAMFMIYQNGYSLEFITGKIAELGTATKGIITRGG